MQKKNVPVAQTTRLVLFGPVLVVATFHLHLHRVFRRLQPIVTVKHSLEFSKKEKIIINVPVAQRRKSRRLGHHHGGDRRGGGSTVVVVNH